MTGGAPGRRRVAGVCAAALAAGALLAPAAQAALSYEEILDALPGRWEIDPAEATDDQRRVHSCEANPLAIRFTEDERGLVYESTYLGVETPALRAPVRSRSDAILIRYDGEQRRTPGGALVEWLLRMPDRDRFYWVRADWAERDPEARTAMRRRCPEEGVA